VNHVSPPKDLLFQADILGAFRNFIDAIHLSFLLDFLIFRSVLFVPRPFGFEEISLNPARYFLLAFSGK
jgi:hypothetical protein